MINKKVLILFIVLIFSIGKAQEVSIKLKVNNEIITNIDIINESNYLTFLNPNLKNLNNEQLMNISKNSLIREKIKYKELSKLFKFEKKYDFEKVIEKRLLDQKNISNIENFKKLLHAKNIKYKDVKKKIKDRRFVEPINL